MVKEEEVHKILTNKAFTNETDSPFKKVEPHKKFNTLWETVYSRNLMEFTKKEMMAKCPKDVVDILVLKKYDRDWSMRPPIIKLEFEKEPRKPHIIIGG